MMTGIIIIDMLEGLAVSYSGGDYMSRDASDCLAVFISCTIFDFTVLFLPL